MNLPGRFRPRERGSHGSGLVFSVVEERTLNVHRNRIAPARVVSSRATILRDKRLEGGARIEEPFAVVLGTGVGYPADLGVENGRFIRVAQHDVIVVVAFALGRDDPRAHGNIA